MSIKLVVAEDGGYSKIVVDPCEATVWRTLEAADKYPYHAVLGLLHSELPDKLRVEPDVRAVWSALPATPLGTTSLGGSEGVYVEPQFSTRRRPFLRKVCVEEGAVTSAGSHGADRHGGWVSTQPSTPSAGLIATTTPALSASSFRCRGGRVVIFGEGVFVGVDVVGA